jgi:hypothetical protein
LQATFEDDATHATFCYLTLHAELFYYIDCSV